MSGPRMLLAVTVVVGAVAMLVSASEVRAWGIDCYFYMAKARGLLHGAGLAANFGGTDRRYFPGASVVLAPFVALFGDRGYLVVNLVAFAATLLCAWRLGMRLGLDEEGAAWGAMLGCATPVAVMWSAMPVSEPLATFLIVAFLLARLHARQSGRAGDVLVAGALLGAAAATRAEAALLGLPWAWDLALLLRARRVRLALTGGVVAATLPALYAGWLLAHPDPGAPANLYLRDMVRYRVHAGAIAGNLLYQASAMYDLRFEGATPRLAVLAVLVARYLVTAAVLAGLVRLRRSAAMRVAMLPILLCGGLHAFWFYQYERFAFVWAPETGLVLALLIDEARRRARSPSSDAALRVAGAALLAGQLWAGAVQGREHDRDMDANEAHVDYRAAGHAFRDDPACAAGVLSFPKPHLAYFIERPVYFYRGDTDFLRADLAPGGFPAFAARTGVRCIASLDPPQEILGELGVPPERAAGAVSSTIASPAPPAPAPPAPAPDGARPPARPPLVYKIVLRS